MKAFLWWIVWIVKYFLVSLKLKSGRLTTM